MVERRLYKAIVGGSIPSLGTIITASLAQRLERRLVEPRAKGSIPLRGATQHNFSAGDFLSQLFAGLAHLVERLLCKQWVAGSSPAAGPKQCPGGESGRRTALRWRRTDRFMQVQVLSRAPTHGGVAEWSNAAALKAEGPQSRSRGFESCRLRQNLSCNHAPYRSAQPMASVHQDVS